MKARPQLIGILFFLLQPALAVFAEVPHALPETPEDRAAYTQFLHERYGFDPKEIRWGKKYPLIVHGGDQAGFTPQAKCDANTPSVGAVDVLVAGAGIAGLTSALYLGEGGKKVLVLEKEAAPGGLATGGDARGTQYGRGGAYFTEVEKTVTRIYDHVGLKGYTDSLAIEEPIDSFYWNGKLYRGLWENKETMNALPASFSVFQFLLKKADEEGLIANQPIEDAPGTEVLDRLSFAQWVRKMPADLQQRAGHDPEAARLLDRMMHDPKVDSADPMKAVIGLMDLYGRSALGDHADKISAAAFANFYISEITTRYTSNIGTGVVARSMVEKLGKLPNVSILSSSPVSQITNTPDGAEACFQTKDGPRKVKARKVVFASPLKIAPGIIDDFPHVAPQHQEAINHLDYRDYAVVNVHVKGHPWKETYDLWVRDDATYSQHEPTDIIDGRWVDFDGKEKPRTDDKGVLTIYVPLAKGAMKGFTEEEAEQLGEKMTDRLKEILGPLAEQSGGHKIEVQAVEVNRWPYSIHVVEPGHFLEKAKVLREPAGNIYFAENNLGTPAVEEALYRGWRAALEILKADRLPDLAAGEVAHTARAGALAAH